MSHNVSQATLHAPGLIETPEQLPGGHLYVFAYGSLLWRPGFRYEAVAPARVHGFHRALRVWSVHHRGTEDRPGLVLGLDAGGSCLGSVFRVHPQDKRATADYLWEREMVTDVYRPRLVRAYTADAAALALTFVLDRAHYQYAGTLPPHEAARHVRHAHGYSGPNPEYVRETRAHLRELGVLDRSLDAVVRHLDDE